MSDCIIWTGTSTKAGYGQRRSNGKRRYIHVLAYEEAFGPVPDGLEIDHLCGNPACYNIEHLEAVTHRENTRRGNGWAGANSRKTHCARGHEFTPENTYIRPDTSGRVCRACKRENDRRYASGVTLPDFVSGRDIESHGRKPRAANPDPVPVPPHSGPTSDTCPACGAGEYDHYGSL